ncbi:MAG: hypothetical protein ABI068_17615 [Ktedonobacterales bacterium]
MGHLFELTDKQSSSLEKVAEAQGQTPDMLLEEWIEVLTGEPRYYETDDFLRHLGVSDEIIGGHEILKTRDWL